MFFSTIDRNARRLSCWRFVGAEYVTLHAAQGAHGIRHLIRPSRTGRPLPAMRGWTCTDRPKDLQVQPDHAGASGSAADTAYVNLLATRRSA